jgi:mannose-6-phosphate isomerase
LIVSEAISKDYTQTDSFIIYICTEGSLQIKVASNFYHLALGETILIPANIKKLQLIPEKNSKIIEVYL